MHLLKLFPYETKLRKLHPIMGLSTFLRTTEVGFWNDMIIFK